MLCLMIKCASVAEYRLAVKIAGRHLSKRDRSKMKRNLKRTAVQSLISCGISPKTAMHTYRVGWNLASEAEIGTLRR